MFKRPVSVRCRASRGAALVVALLTLVVVVLITGAVLQAMLAHRRQAALEEHRLQATAIAEAALERAIVKLRQQPDYQGETWSVTIDQGTDQAAEAHVEIRVSTTATEPPKKQITATATFPQNSARRASAERTHVLHVAGDSKTTAEEQKP